MITTILFDLGGTLWDDFPSVRASWEDIREELRALGIKLTDTSFNNLVDDGIAAYAPSLTRTIIWRAVRGDYSKYRRVVRAVIERLKERMERDFFRYNRLYAGVRDVLDELKGKYLLGVASNNISEARGWLAKFELTDYFSTVGISEELWLFKPDTRFYERILHEMGAPAEETMMVGDRLDNDIFPCNRLRMTTVRVLSEPYRRQEPRYHTDQPDFTIKNVSMLPSVLKLLNAGLAAKARPAP